MTVKTMRTNFGDVVDFHRKFMLTRHGKPVYLPTLKLLNRIEFLFEEFKEFLEGSGFTIIFDDDTGEFSFEPIGGQDLAKQADALIDLVYVAMGTAVMMGLPWQTLWDDVQRANMAKIRGETHRGHDEDVCKPPEWLGPRTHEIIIDAIRGELKDEY